MKHIRIKLPTSKNDTKIAVPQGMRYWNELWDTYTEDFTSVEIHCWTVETERLGELKPLAAYSKVQGLIMTFTITLDERNWSYLRGQSIDPEGGLKWFTLYFYKNGIQMLEIAQYGSEIVLYGVDKKEADEFVKLFPDNTSSEYFKEHPM